MSLCQCWQNEWESARRPAAHGAAIGVGLIGMKAAERVGRNPGAATKILVQAILAIASPKHRVYALFLVR